MNKKEYIKQGNKLITTIKEKYYLDSLTIKVDRYYTDVDGVVIDKSTVPADFKQKFPFYLWGAFDKNGAFSIGQKIAPPEAATKYMYTMIVRSSYDFLEFTGLNTVKNYMKVGDMVSVYTDDLTAPSYFCFIIVSCPFQAYGSVVENTFKKTMSINDIYYFSDTQENYNETIFIPVNNPVGIYKVNQYQPFSFQTPDMAAKDFIILKMPFNITPAFAFYSYLTFNTDNLSFQFNLKYT